MGTTPDHTDSLAGSRQVEIYGESWSDRLSRLLRGYRISQARLAAVIGLSAPMISQLMTGHRVKISNPAVYGRIVGLEEFLADDRVQAGDPTRIGEILADVAISHPVLTTRNLPAGATAHSAPVDPGIDPAAPAIEALAAAAEPGVLLEIAATARGLGAPALVDLLVRAARHGGQG
jgi:hypothetical protein